jgi:hypothetical protein
MYALPFGQNACRDRRVDAGGRARWTLSSCLNCRLAHLGFKKQASGSGSVSFNAPSLMSWCMRVRSRFIFYQCMQCLVRRSTLVPQIPRAPPTNSEILESALDPGSCLRIYPWAYMPSASVPRGVAGACVCPLFIFDHVLSNLPAVSQIRRLLGRLSCILHPLLAHRSILFVYWCYCRPAGPNCPSGSCPVNSTAAKYTETGMLQKDQTDSEALRSGGSSAQAMHDPGLHMSTDLDVCTACRPLSIFGDIPLTLSERTWGVKDSSKALIESCPAPCLTGRSGYHVGALSNSLALYSELYTSPYSPALM